MLNNSHLLCLSLSRDRVSLAQAGLELLGLRNPLAAASWVAGIAGASIAPGSNHPNSEFATRWPCLVKELLTHAGLFCTGLQTAAVVPLAGSQESWHQLWLPQTRGSLLSHWICFTHLWKFYLLWFCPPLLGFQHRHLKELSPLDIVSSWWKQGQSFLWTVSPRQWPPLCSWLRFTVLFYRRPSPSIPTPAGIKNLLFMTMNTSFIV